MSRSLLRYVSRVVVLKTPQVVCPSSVTIVCGRQQQWFQRSYRLSVSAVGDVPLPKDADIKFLPPYEAGHERSMTKKRLSARLCHHFDFTPEELKHILDSETVTKYIKEQPYPLSLEVLCKAGVEKRSIVDFPWVITLDKDNLEAKLALIGCMPYRNINHFIPFLYLSKSYLRKMVKKLNEEGATLPEKNRLYHICDLLKTDPYVTAKSLSRRLFIFNMKLDVLKRNIKILRDYDVASNNILRDLWVFRYRPNSIQKRFDRAKSAQKDKIMPWMVRCSEEILQRSLQLSVDELNVLGDKNSMIEYVAGRLQFDVQVTEAIMQKHPQVFSVRVTKVKEVLDYLLNEVHFDRYEIAQVPRILCHSLETTKKRFEELKSLGCRPSSLVILCRSKREYAKFLQNWKIKTSTVEQK